MFFGVSFEKLLAGYGHDLGDPEFARQIEQRSRFIRHIGQTLKIRCVGVNGRGGRNWFGYRCGFEICGCFSDRHFIDHVVRQVPAVSRRALDFELNYVTSVVLAKTRALMIISDQASRNFVTLSSS